MSSFFNDFNTVSKKEWADKIHTDLHGKDPSVLSTDDPIEDLNFSCFYHSEDQLARSNPGSFPLTRGNLKSKNTWENGVFIEIDNEKEANVEALHALMTGADLIWFKATNFDTNWSEVLNEIKIEFIQLQISPKNNNDVEKIRKITQNSTNVQFNIDFIESKNFIIGKNTSIQRSYLVNGFGIQRLGGTSWQEIAFCLNVGHEYLLQLINQGLNIDEASSKIAFHIGIGSNYFYEIAKIRSLKHLWSKIIDAYNPEDKNAYSCSITAVIGHMNKSLDDPHTNLLRQTTESMSALSAGVDQIIVLPYDLYSQDGKSKLAQRMALNIPIILQEESYFDMVIDPIGGSYMIEQLTDLIGKKAWSEFQSIEENGGLLKPEGRNLFKVKVNEKRIQRIAHFEQGNQLLIGINKFKSQSSAGTKWKVIPEYLGIKALNFEIISKNVSL